MQRPDSDIEAAIKLLQANGYEVFQASAAAKLACVERIGVDVHCAYRNRQSYREHRMLNHARKIGEELLRAEALEFTEQVEEDRANFRYMIDSTATLRFFPMTRKEWRRM